MTQAIEADKVSNMSIFIYMTLSYPYCLGNNRSTNTTRPPKQYNIPLIYHEVNGKMSGNVIRRRFFDLPIEHGWRNQWDRLCIQRFVALSFIFRRYIIPSSPGGPLKLKLAAVSG
jgi:hypothetical protein